MTTPTAAGAEEVTGRWRHPEILLALLVVALGAVCLVEASTIPTNAATRGPLGSSAMPTAVGVLLVVAGVLIAVDVLRGGAAEVEGSEDIDLTQAPDFRAVGLLVLVFLGNAVLIERVGWPVSGAVLFWGCVVALGSRRFARDAVISLVMSVGSYLLFTGTLGVNLPAGLLEGIL